MHRCFQAHFARFGITADQFVVLTLLAEEDGIIQKELVRRTYSDANTITALLGLLEKKGLVQRVRPQNDGRVRCIYLTPEGRQLQQDLSTSAESLHQQLRQAVPPEELPALLRCLHGIATEMTPIHQSKKKVSTSTRTP
jgi:MarR family transcriptional regulator for hemolysin